MSAFAAGTWPEFIQFEVALARLAVSCGQQGAERVEALRDRALALAVATGIQPCEALRRVGAVEGVA